MDLPEEIKWIDQLVTVANFSNLDIQEIGQKTVVTNFSSLKLATSLLGLLPEDLQNLIDERLRDIANAFNDDPTEDEIASLIRAKKTVMVASFIDRYCCIRYPTESREKESTAHSVLIRGYETSDRIGGQYWGIARIHPIIPSIIPYNESIYLVLFTAIDLRSYFSVIKNRLERISYPDVVNNAKVGTFEYMTRIMRKFEKQPVLSETYLLKNMSESYFFSSDYSFGEITPEILEKIESNCATCYRDLQLIINEME